jgi:hypothetical protein
MTQDNSEQTYDAYHQEYAPNPISAPTLTCVTSSLSFSLALALVTRYLSTGAQEIPTYNET